MRIEGRGTYHATAENPDDIGREVVFRERLGGPLKPNHLLTTRLGVNESKPILERLKVCHRISLYALEAPLGQEAVAPAEYRIEIMDPKNPKLPAPEAYVQFVLSALKEAKVPVQKGGSRREHENG